MRTTPVPVWLYAPDLMDRSRVVSAHPETHVVADPQALLDAPPGATVLVDLGRDGVLDVLARLGARRTVGFANHEDDELMEGVELGEDLSPVGELVDREERPGEQEHRRDDERRYVVELVDLRDAARDRDAETGECEGRDQREERNEQHSRRRIEAEADRDDQREGPEDAGAEADPEHLAADQLLDVDRGGEDRVVGALEAVLDEGAEHRRQRAREDDRGRDHAGPDELDVVDAVDAADERRSEPDPESEQVDHRLDQAREGRAAPERPEVRNLAAHHAEHGGGLDPPHSSSSPVRLTKTPSSELGRVIASSGIRPSGACSQPTITSAGPADRTASPAATAAARTSARRSGGA